MLEAVYDQKSRIQFLSQPKLMITNSRRPMRLIFAALFYLLAFAIQATGPAFALTPVSLQLKWTHGFQFAGYYAAQEMGFYRDAGLEVDIREAYPGIDVAKLVTERQADFGVGSSALLINRSKGQSVVVIAVIFQHSPYVLITSGGQTGKNIHDLAGKRIMLEDQSAELEAYLIREGIPPDQLRLEKHHFNPNDLINGRTDAMSGYISTEPYFLHKAKFSYQMFSPRAAGIDFYGDNLFTAQKLLHERPEIVTAFRSASLRGWQYAMEHKAEMIRLIHQKYAPNLPLDYLEFEARELSALIKADQVAPGYMYRGRWQHIRDVYSELGMLPKAFTLDGFLYDPNASPDYGWLYLSLGLALAGVALIGGITAYIFRINRRLAKTLAEVQVLSTAIEQSPISIVITSPEGVVEYVNPHFTEETGYSEAEIIGQKGEILVSEEVDPAIYQGMKDKLRNGMAWTGEFASKTKSGKTNWEEIHIAPVKGRHGETTHFVSVRLDVTERKRVHERLDHLAHYDILTGLPNRILFFERLSQSLLLAQRNCSRLAMLLIDLDHFKPINDTWGHATGDAVLQEAARRMAACIRESDTVGRIGGDEFAAVLNDIGPLENAVRVADKIRVALNEAFTVNGKSMHISSSIGIALFPDDGQSESELSCHADLAMYQAKSCGRNRVEVFACCQQAKH